MPVDATRRGLVKLGERGGLPLEGRHEVGAGAAEHARARTRRTREATRRQVAHDPVRVVQGEKDVVGSGRRDRPELGVHAGDGPEELDGRVDQVRPEIEQQPTGDRVVLLPAVLRDGAPAFPPALEAVHGPERPVGEQRAQRELLGVPTTVLEHGERHAHLRGGPHQGTRPGGVRCERLVDDQRKTPGDHGDRVVDVMARRARDHHEVEVAGPLDERPDVGQDDDAGPVGSRRGGPLRVADDDVGDQVTRRAQQPGVDPPPRVAVPDDSHPELPGRTLLSHADTLCTGRDELFQRPGSPARAACPSPAPATRPGDRLPGRASRGWAERAPGAPRGSACSATRSAARCRAPAPARAGCAR